MNCRLGTAAFRSALLASSWLAGAVLCQWLFAAPDGAALWLPAGIAAAVFERSGRIGWPRLGAVSLGAAAFCGWQGRPAEAYAWLVLIHTAEPALVVVTLRCWRRVAPAAPLAGPLAPWFAAAPAGLAAAALEPVVLGARLEPATLAGGALGHVVGTVLALSLAQAAAFARADRRFPRGRGLAESALALSLLWALSRLIFASPLGQSPLPLHPFAVLPLLVWATLRSGSLGAGVGSLVLAVEALRQAAAGRGPLVVPALGPAAAIQTQAFVAVLALTMLVLGEALAGRERVAQALRRSEAALRRDKELACQAEAAVQVGSWHVDLQTGRVTVSEETRRLAGLEADALEGLLLAPTIDERVHEDDRERVLALLASLSSGTPLAPFELRVRLPDGCVRSLRVEAGPLLPDDAGRPRHVYGVIEDVTDERRLEAALSESEERYRTLFEDSPSVMLVLETGSGRVVDANPAACGLYGRTRDELRALSLFQLSALPGEQVAGLLAAAERGQQASFESRHRGRGGELREVVEHCGSVRVGGRALLHLVVHDVTEVRRSEEAARRGMYEATARLRSVIDATPLGVLMLSDELEVRLANPAAAHLLAGRQARIVGRPIGALLEPDVALGLTTPLLHGEAVSGIEIEHARHDGTRVALRISGAPLRLPEGYLRGAVLILEDTTERRLVDETLRLAQKLEVLATVAGGVAHDFNNLLTVILGHSERALARLTPGDPARAHLERALPAVEQAIGVARQLLVYSGGSRPIIGPLDIGGLVREERAMLAATVPGHVRLEISQPDELPTVEASAEEIRQALTALLANAVEAIGGRRGRVRLSLATLHLEEGEAAFSRHTGQPLADGEFVSLAVEDDGSGMQPEVLPRIFDPFFTTKFVGRGLGLAAVLGIVRSHRGGIAVDSTPGRGSRFEIVLPVSRPPAVDDEQPASAQEKLPRREPIADVAPSRPSL